MAQKPTNNTKLAVKTSDLGYLGEDFQEKLIRCFFEDKPFFHEIQHIVDQNMFSTDHLRRIVGIMKDRYAQSAQAPTYEEVKLLIRATVRDAATIELLLALVDKIQNIRLEGMDIVKEQTGKFFKQQNLIKAVNKIVDIIKVGNLNDYDRAESIIQDALMVNNRQDNGFRLFESIEADLSPDYRQTIPTGCSELDAAMYGGIGRRELGVIVAPMGTGKAQPLSSKVLTPSGFKTMGEIEVGDMVIGGDGKPHKVIGTFPQEGLRPVYKVYFSNGEVVECDIDHLWNVNTYYQRTRKTYKRGTGKLNCKREFNPDYTFKTWSLKEIIERGIIKEFKNGRKTYIFKVPHVQPIEFENRQVEVDPYLAGYYIGDGCYRRSEITVGKQDFDKVYDMFKHICGEDIGIFHDNRDIYTIRIINETRQKLNKLFDKCIKSDKKVIPVCYIQNDINTRLSVLQGLLDSDGTVDKRGLVLFSTKSRELAEQVKYLVKSLGGEASISTKQAKYRKNDEIVDCGVSYNVIISFDENSRHQLFRLSRKQDRVRYRNKYLERTYITSIEYDREDYTKCILVDSDEHTYVTDGYIVTHNTSVTTGFAASAAIHKCAANNFKGFKVLHLFFEDEEINIRRKYYGYVLDIDACDLSLEDVRPLAIQRLNEDSEIKDMLRNNIKGKRLSTGEVTASGIKAEIQRQTALGFKPDLVVVDYFECLAKEKSGKVGPSDSEWTAEAVTMRKLESLCKELNIAMWVPVQGTKGSIGQEYVGLMHAGGSVAKTQIGHIVIQLAQTKQQKSQGIMNVFIGKLRAVRIDKDEFLNVRFNNGTGKFDMSSMQQGAQEVFEYPNQTQQQVARQVAGAYGNGR